jgi:hypothetical protein
MEADLSSYAAGYVLARVGIVCALGYFILRALFRRRGAPENPIGMKSCVERVYAVPEDRC